MKCVCCKDPASQWDSQGRMVCESCYMELEHGVIRNHNINFHVGRTRDKRPDHPEWDTAVKQIEDQFEDGPLM